MNNKKLVSFVILIILAFISGFIVNDYELFPYSIIKTLYLENQSSHTQNKIYENDVSSLIHIHDYSSKNEIKKNLINFLWKETTIPDHEPFIIEKNISDSRYLNMENLESIDKLTIQMESEMNSIAYFFHPENNNGKLIIYHQGHRGDFFEGKETIEYFLKRNYSVIGFSMPLLGMNSQPIVENATFGNIHIQSHNQLKFLESENLSPIKFFIEPVLVALNHVEYNYEFDSIYMVGISGGGWTTTIVSALDDRIEQSFSIAGSYPLFLRNETKNFGDYEQNHLELYEIGNYLDLYIMASSGIDRKFIQIFNKYDPCCFDGDSFSSYESHIKQTLKKMGDGHFEIYLDDTHKEHIISNHSLEIIISEIENQ